MRNLILFSLTIWVSANLAVSAGGLMSSGYGRFSLCGKKRNIDYILPGFTIGCWLGQERK